MAAVLHLRTAHLARVVVLKRQDSGETKARHYVAYGLKVGQKSILGGFGQSVIGPKRANRVVPQAVPNPYMMHMLGRGQRGCGRAACGAMPELVANTPLRVW